MNFKLSLEEVDEYMPSVADILAVLSPLNLEWRILGASGVHLHNASPSEWLDIGKRIDGILLTPENWHEFNETDGTCLMDALVVGHKPGAEEDYKQGNRPEFEVKIVPNDGYYWTISATRKNYLELIATAFPKNNPYFVDADDPNWR